MAKPALLFLDEPTSGLDGQSAYEICRFLRRLAGTGLTIICTIHQPSAVLFESFHALMLLARGGKTTYFGPTGEKSEILLDYFARHGAPCPPDTNPAEHIVDVVQGRLGDDVDWPQKWSESEECRQALQELDQLNQTANEKKPVVTEEQKSFATPISYQIRLVTWRQLVSLWRNPDYVCNTFPSPRLSGFTDFHIFQIWNKIGLHVTSALFTGFTFWQLGDSSFELQLRMMTVFSFVFVAVGCVNQLQPLFIRNRDIFETREKKSKVYHWLSFISAQLLSEIPALIVCATLFFACWYFTSGLPVKASASGAVYFEVSVLLDLLC